MAQTDTSQTIEHLKRFLIIRLLAVMVFIFACEAIINLIVTRIMFPVFNTLFGTEPIFTNQSAGENIILLLRMAGYLLLTGINILLPNGLAGIFSYISAGLWKNSNLLTGMSGTEQMLIFVVLFVFICLYLLPYMVGILYYSGIVVRKMEEVREYDRRQQEAFARKRNLLLSDITHELKTPIALIQGYAEGLKENISDDPESREFYCDVIMDEASKMNKLVKNLLTLNQLESGKDAVVMERFDIISLIRGVLQTMNIMIGQKEANVIFEAEKPVYVWADEFKIEEVVTNYVSNALNHLDGEKEIEIKLQDEDNRVKISVFNTGTPIPEADVPNLWNKFYKVDKARTREYGGSGIGLSIVKAIMESMNQEYGVQNFDNGVEFWFTLDRK